MAADDQAGGRERYHHGNLREALIQAALAMIAERGLAGFAIAELARVVGVSPAAPYRHFRDRNAVIAEVARRGFESLAADLTTATAGAQADPLGALERAAQAHIAFAGREPAVYAAMFDAGFPSGEHPELVVARNAAFAVLRRVADAACAMSRAPRRPPPLMVALHVWSLTHGIATLFVSHDSSNRLAIPMSPEALLEAGLLIYLQALDLPAGASRPEAGTR
jgi:AcrR family transcriptional regulator